MHIAISTDSGRQIYKKRAGVCKMKRYVCDMCGWRYEEAAGCEEQNVAPNTKWEDVPEDFVCPLCGVGKESFSEE